MIRKVNSTKTMCLTTMVVWLLLSICNFCDVLADGDVSRLIEAGKSASYLHEVTLSLHGPHSGAVHHDRLELNLHTDGGDRKQPSSASKILLSSTTVDVARIDQDTLLLTASKALHKNVSVLPAGGVDAVVRTAQSSDTAVLLPRFLQPSHANFMRALASLLTPLRGGAAFEYHIKNDLYGSCELVYERRGLVTKTTRDVLRCTHYATETSLGLHAAPLLLLGMDMVGSSSECLYRWQGGGVPASDGGGDQLDEVTCSDSHVMSPVTASHSQSINVTLVTTFTKVSESEMSQRQKDAVNNLYDSASLLLQPPVLEGRDCSGIVEKVERMCSMVSGSEPQPDLLLKEVLALSSSLACSPAFSSLQLPPMCDLHKRSAVAIAAALAGGPRALSLFYQSLPEVLRVSDTDMGVEVLFPLALHRLALPDPLTPPHVYSLPDNMHLYTQVTRAGESTG